MADLTGLHTPPTTGEASTKGYVDSLAGGGGGGLPIGAIVPYTGTSAPANTLLCDGSAVSRTTYATLFGILGTSYGAGDGSTTFNVPNLTGTSRIPIGLDAGQATVNARGNAGGSLNHTHTSTAHVHSFSHLHGQSHSHTYDHSHTMASHTHTAAHSHSQAGHTHALTTTSSGAHFHSPGALSYSIGTHTHGVPERDGAGTGNTGAPRPANVAGTLNTTTSNNGQTLGISGTIGNTGGNNGDTGVAAGATSSDGTDSPDPGTSGPSTNTTSTATGSTSTDSTNTSTAAINTDSGGGGLTTDSANPPYLTVNFIIQAL